MKQINSAILKAELKDLQEVVNEQLDELISLDGKIPQIEFDIIMENIRKIYSDLQLLYRLNDPLEKKIPTEERLSAPEQVVTSQPSPVIRREEIPAGRPAEIPSNQPASSSSHGNIPTDIKALININDKFLFINELFDGNLRDYSLAIEQLNSIKEKPASFAFIDGLMRENFWDTQSPAFRKLREILEKRFV
jgi:hypothetical protein